MRTKSKYYTPEFELLLNKLVTQISIEEYKETFYKIGHELSCILNNFIDGSGSTMLACASEDADWLAKGILDSLSDKESALAVFWNDRQNNVDPTLTITPIVKSYIENIKYCKTLIIVKSIIVTSCVVKTQLSRLIEEISPQKILIVAPVMYKGADQTLKNEFPTNINEKFSFIYIAVDDTITTEGEVSPGIGGMIYSRLGLGDFRQKNKYIPEIVKKRRE